MSDAPMLRFVTDQEKVVESIFWGSFDWLSRPGLTAAEQLILIRVHIPPGQGHSFHRHPHQEEIIYILDGQAEQWVDRERRIVGPGTSIHIPTNTVHCTFNAGTTELVALAILSPAKIDGPAIIDVYNEKPWCDLRG